MADAIYPPIDGEVAVPTLRGRIFDRQTGRPLEARVGMIASTGAFCAPEVALRKVGPGAPFFYADGTFEVDVPLGQTDVVVERGTEYHPSRLVVQMPPRGAVEV